VTLTTITTSHPYITSHTRIHHHHHHPDSPRCLPPPPNGTNGHSTPSPSRPFNDGVYTPLITAMTEDEEVDLEAVKKQVVRLADAGMGIVLLGTNGEGES
jgi:hypothetical protein